MDFGIPSLHRIYRRSFQHPALRGYVQRYYWRSFTQLASGDSTQSQALTALRARLQSRAHCQLHPGRGGDGRVGCWLAGHHKSQIWLCNPADLGRSLVAGNGFIPGGLVSQTGTGGSTWTADMEAIGTPGSKLIPVKSPLHAVLFGAVWGWLPCGLVYTTLIWASSAGAGMDTALLMLAFGLGTLPTVLTAGIIVGWMARLSMLAKVRKIAGISLIIMAIISPIYALQEKNHEHQLPNLGHEHAEH